MTNREYINSLTNEELGALMLRIGNEYIFQFVDCDKWLNKEYIGTIDKSTYEFLGKPAKYKNDPNDDSFEWMDCFIENECSILGNPYVEIVNPKYPIVYKIPAFMIKKEDEK